MEPSKQARVPWMLAAGFTSAPGEVDVTLVEDWTFVITNVRVTGTSGGLFEVTIADTTPRDIWACIRTVEAGNDVTVNETGLLLALDSIAGIKITLSAAGIVYAVSGYYLLPESGAVLP
jgi:hypothetical protein